MEQKISMKEACELIAKMFNLEKSKGRDNWTGEEIFNASPTGELFHVFQYYEIAKNYFGILENEIKVKPENPPIGTTFRDTVLNEILYYTGEKWVNGKGQEMK